MDKVSERFILEYEVRDSIFFLSMIPCVVCVKCGRVFHSLSKYYSLLCLLFSVMFGVCFFAVHTNSMLSAFVNEDRSPVKCYSLLFAFVNEHRSLVKRYLFNTLFLTFALVGIVLFSLLVIEFFYNLAGIRRFLDISLLRDGCRYM